MNRRLLAALSLVLLLGLGGCTSIFGGGGVDPEALSEDATYDFDADRDAYVEINEDNYTAVYNVSAIAGGEDDPTVQLYTTDALTIERPLEVRAVQYRYPNGTIVRFVDGEAVRVDENGSTTPTDALEVEGARDRTTVHVPTDAGRLAFTTPKTGKEVALQTPADGSYEVALPPDADASLPLLSRVRPPNDDRRVVGDRVHLTWETLDAELLIVRWYLDRDLWLFGGLAAIAIVVGSVGAVYYYRQIQRARRLREEEGLDVDYEDDREGPPPGMG
jgi:hypothetical protein